MRTQTARTIRESAMSLALATAVLVFFACHSGEPVHPGAEGRTDGALDDGGAAGSRVTDGAVETGGAGGTNAGGSGGASGADGGTGGVGAAGTGGSGGTDGGATGAGGDSGTDAGAAGCVNQPSAPPSCAGLADTCGVGANEDCCTTLCVPGGTFALGRKAGDPDNDACDAFTCDPDEAPAVTATVRAFWLDRFEVTVGRYRKFVAAGSPEPAAGAGKHGYLTGGTEPGWDTAWSVQSVASLLCDPTYQTWTSSPGANENEPINCVDWYSANAFCIWDDGFLPTEAEWELAASGGEERVFPWSEPAGEASIDTARACYMGCGGPRRVGSKPAGDGRWGHADLAGNVNEWVLDRYAASYPISPCSDCANLSTVSSVVRRGGNFDDAAKFVRSARRGLSEVGSVGDGIGFRCARTE